MGKLSRAFKSVVQTAKKAAPYIAPGLVAAHSPDILRSLAPLAATAFGGPVAGGMVGMLGSKLGSSGAMASGGAEEYFGAEQVPASGFAGIGDLISRAGDFAKRYRGIPDLGGMVAESAEEYFDDDEYYDEDEYYDDEYYDEEEY